MKGRDAKKLHNNLHSSIHSFQLLVFVFTFVCKVVHKNMYVIRFFRKNGSMKLQTLHKHT